MANAHRLIYRGALELPDSYIVLDGLSFILSLGAKDGRLKATPNLDLLQNPLALALESMRGRSLQFLGTTKVKDVFVDSSCDANVYVHPNSTLTRTYLENVLCLSPITSSDGKTEQGVRVGLGDQDVLGSSEILIYGRLHSDLASESYNPVPEFRLLAARIVPAPAPSIRPPRPDDPTPRQPPLVVFGEKRARESAKDKEETAVKRAKDVMRNLPKLASTSTKPLVPIGSNGSFKIPDIPSKVNNKEIVGSGPTQKSKSKANEHDKDCGDVDKTNKADIKRSAVRCLAEYNINREHRDFKELFGFVYRGASFALRLHMSSKLLDSHLIDELVEMHVRLYIRGDGVFVRSD